MKTTAAGSGSRPPIPTHRSRERWRDGRRGPVRASRAPSAPPMSTRRLQSWSRSPCTSIAARPVVALRPATRGRRSDEPHRCRRSDPRRRAGSSACTSPATHSLPTATRHRVSPNSSAASSSAALAEVGIRQTIQRLVLKGAADRRAELAARMSCRSGSRPPGPP